MKKPQAAFTIVELLIVIVVIAILAAISIVAYNGIQARAKNTQLQSAISDIQKKLELYNADKGSYPATQSVALTFGSPTSAMTYVDSGCHLATGVNVNRTAAWVPGIDMTLPQSTDQVGVEARRGCFMYQSDGTYYILSAWNMVYGDPQNSAMYRRIGFREMNQTAQYIHCNHANIGGNNPTPYVAVKDYYKYSYTVSNFAGCNETPPTGA